MASESAKLCGPINSMGHTAHVVSNRMIVIFGHSPKYGYLDTVQEYHFFNKEWSIPPTTGMLKLFSLPYFASSLLDNVAESL